MKVKKSVSCDIYKIKYTPLLFREFLHDTTKKKLKRTRNHMQLFNTMCNYVHTMCNHYLSHKK